MTLRTLACACVLTALLSGYAAFPVATTARSAPLSTPLTLDGVTLSVAGPAVARVGGFDAAPPGSAVQSASATSRNPYREISLTAMPFGAKAGTEQIVGVARSGGAADTRAALRAYRAGQHARSVSTPSARLFDRDVAGNAALLQLNVDGAEPVPTVVVEWVTEAGPRLWLVRVSEEIVGDVTPAKQAAAVAELSGIVIEAVSSVATRTTAVPAAPGNPAPPPPTAIRPAGRGVASPTWWSGDCDSDNYSAAALRLTGTSISAYRLSPGAMWNGLEACGPRPFYNEGPDVGVAFPGTNWGVAEFECVELSMRWMYLAWGVHPYPANGSQVVWNYAGMRAGFNANGPNLISVSNNGVGPMPVAGDVLSYGSTSTFGHTSVVTGSSIDANGNGHVTVLEENASATGWDTVSVSGWVLGGFDGGVSGWLHNPAASANAEAMRVVVRGLDGGGWVQSAAGNASPQFTNSWNSLGGAIVGAPAVVSIPTPGGAGAATPYYLATFTDHDVWVRGESTVWQRLTGAPVNCVSSPGVSVVRDRSTTTLVIACQGSDRQLWYAETAAPTDPTINPTVPAGGWLTMGGQMVEGPALAAIVPTYTAHPPISGGSSRTPATMLDNVVFFVNGTDGHVWSRRVGSGAGWLQTGWRCVGHLAAATTFTSNTSLVSAFTCEGTDGGIWLSTTVDGAHWAVVSLGPMGTGGPGLALTPAVWTVVAQGADNQLWSESGWTSGGPSSGAGWVPHAGTLTDGANSVALVESSAVP